MRILRNILPAAALLALLSGCDAPSDAKKTPVKTESPSAKAAPSTPANVVQTPQGAPKRKDGYWEMASISVDGSEMDKQLLCVGGDSEDKYSIFDQLAVAGDCTKKDFKRTLAGWDFETRCSMLNMETVQKGTISGDFQTNFRVDQTVT